MSARAALTLRETIGIQAWWYGRKARDWCLRWVYAQHNARVIIDFEARMISVICEASGNMMSKAYYDADVMLEMIRANISQTFDDGYAEGRKDLAEELGVEATQEAP